MLPPPMHDLGTASGVIGVGSTPAGYDLETTLPSPINGLSTGFTAIGIGSTPAVHALGTEAMLLSPTHDLCTMFDPLQYIGSTPIVEL